MHRLPFSSLRVRAVLLVLLVAAPVGALVWFSATELQRSVAASVQEHAGHLVRLVAGNQQRFTSDTHLLLTTLSRLPEVRSEDPGACSALFAGLLEEFPQYANLGAISPNGEVFCSGYPFSGSVREEARFLQPTFEQVLARRQFMVGDYQISSITGKPVVIYAYPVRNRTGGVAAVLFATLDLSWLSTVPPAVQLPPGTTLTVVDDDGIVLVRYPDTTHWVGEDIQQAELFRTMVAQGGEGTAILAGLDDVERLYAFTSLPGDPERNIGYVSIGIPVGEAFAETDWIVRRDLMLLALLAALVLAGAWVGSGWFITAPHAQLLNATRRLAAGDLEARVGPLGGAQELRELGRAFDAMAASLTARQQEAERARRELQLSEERYRLITRATQDVVWDWDIVHGRAYWSDALTDVFGYTPEAAAAGYEWWSECIHPDDRERVVAEIEAAVAGGAETWSAEYRFCRADGSSAVVFGRGYIARDERGRVVRMIGSMQDIGERRAAQEALRLRLRQQAAVAELGQRALEGTDLAVLLEAAVQLVAATLEVEYAHVLELLPEENVLFLRAGVGWPEEAVGVVRVSAGPESQAGFTLRSAEPVLIEDLDSESRFAGSSLLREQGVVSGISVTIGRKEDPFGVLGAHSASRHSFTEDDLNFFQAVANVLGTAVERERTDEALWHAEHQFREAQKMEAIGRLAGGIAHDFNNLLTVIRGNTEILLEDLPEATALHQYTEEVGQAAVRAGELTQQLLAYSRQQIMQPRVLDLNQVVRTLEDMLRRLIGEDVLLQTQLASRLGKVMADPGQIEQVLLNLGVNARDAMPRGGTLTIATRNVEVDGTEPYTHADDIPPGSYVQLRVADTGIGMTEEILSRLWEPFFTTKEVGKGTGLGLPTVHGIVHQSGGHVWVESEPGQGSTFYVLLPRVDRPAEPVATQPTVESAPAGSETVLLVEDESTVRALARRILERHGYSVLEASDVENALRLCHEYEGAVHLVLTDVVMPGMSGPELAERLLTIRPQLRVLYMSGYTDDALVEHGVLEPGVQLLQKPFSPLALVHRVRAVLDSENGGRPPA